MSLVALERSLVDCPIRPSVDAFSVHQILDPFSSIHTAVLEPIDPQSVSLPIFVVSFVSIVVIAVHSDALLLHSNVIRFTMGIGFILEILHSLNLGLILDGLKHVLTLERHFIFAGRREVALKGLLFRVSLGEATKVLLLELY